MGVGAWLKEKTHQAGEGIRKIPGTITDGVTVNGHKVLKRDEKPTLPPAIDKEREETAKKLASDPNVKNEEAYYNKTYGPGTGPAAQGLIKMYLDRAGKKDAPPVTEKEVKDHLDTFAVKGKDGVNVPLTDKEKTGAREMTWGAFSTMKGLVREQGLDSKYIEVVVNGPVPVKDKPNEFSKISVLGTRK